MTHVRRWKDILQALFVLLSPLVLSACQTDDVVSSSQSDASKPAAQHAAATGFYNIVAGNGPLAVGYLGIRRADAASRQAEFEYRNGALLAVNLRGGAIVNLNLMESSEKHEDIVRTARALEQKGINILLTTAHGGELALIRDTLAAKAIPVIAFSTNTEVSGLGETIYPFVSTPRDSLFEAASYAVAEGGRRAVILSAQAMDKAEILRYDNRIKALGLPAPVILDMSAGLTQPKAIKAWREADLVIVMPEVKNPASVIKALNASAASAPPRHIVVSTAHSSSELNDPILSGSNVCRYDHNVGERMGQRYMSTYGLPASAASAYGFDAMSMIIGLVDKYGGVALSKPYLTQDGGFAGAMGLFRFNADNSVQRNCDIFKVANGRFVFIQRAPPTF